jgi:uncharacterized membrane protein
MNNISAKGKSGFNRLHITHRIIIALMLTAVLYFFIRSSGMPNQLVYMLLFDLFTGVLICFSWITFFITPYEELRGQAKEQDGSRIVVFVLLLVCACVSMYSVVVLLLDDSGSKETKTLELVAAVAGMLLSWVLVHTVFTFRYAHMYYANHKTKPGSDAEGLEFPGNEKPDFPDFAYFSFVLGMTFQVSDVEILQKSIRRLALLHGFISFLYNTTIIGLTINILAGRGK